MEHQDLQHPLTDAQIEAQKENQRKELAERIAKLETAVAELQKGKN